MNRCKALFFCMVLIVFLGNGSICTAAEESDQNRNKSNTKLSSYIIGAGDVLKIVTWKEADFTVENALVRTDGKITFPLLNDVQAAGLTPLILKDVLERGLKNYVANPVVNVTVINPGSKKFYIIGEVLRIGEYPLVKGLTVIQALALAGGFTEWAAKDEILVLRQNNEKTETIRVDYKKIIKGKDLKQNILVNADDTIIVP